MSLVTVFSPCNAISCCIALRNSCQMCLSHGTRINTFIRPSGQHRKSRSRVGRTDFRVLLTSLPHGFNAVAPFCSRIERYGLKIGGKAGLHGRAFIARPIGKRGMIAGAG